MSLTNKDNNESTNLISKIIKIKGELASDTSIKTNHISQKSSNTKLLISKDKLKSLINDTKKYFKNNKLVKHKTKITLMKKSSNKLKSEETNKKGQNKVLNVNDKNNKRKKGNINIITDNINNYKFNSEINNGSISKTQLADNETYDNNSFENNINHLNKNKFQYFDTYNFKNYLTNEKSDDNKNIYNLHISASHLILHDIEKKCKEYLLYYNCDITQYNIKVINDIISDQNKHIVSEFKNYLLWDDSSEYLKRYYYINEIKFRLKPIASYYISYTYFSPVYYCNLEIIKILLKNVKRKNNYYKEIENFEDKILDENDNDNNSISSFFEERRENLEEEDDTESNFSNEHEKKKKNFDFVPIIDSSDINKKSQVSSINKKSLSLSITLKNCECIIDSNTKRTKKTLLKEKDIENNDACYKYNLSLNKNNLFNTAITPIKKKCNDDKIFNGEFQFQKLNFNTKKDLNEKSNKENNKNKENLNSKKKEKELNISKNKNKENKLYEEKINSHKNKINELQNKIKDKKFKSYRTTDDMNILLNNNIDQSKDIIYVKKKSNKKEEKRNGKIKDIKNIISQKTILNSNISNNNFEKNASIIINNKNNLKKFQFNNESKLTNSINCLTQRNKLLNESNKINNIISKDYSLIIHNKNNHLNSSINSKNNNMKVKMNFNNIIRNINHKYIKISKFPRLLTSNDRKNNFSSKKSLEFPFKFHSLSSNRKRLLKISDSYNSKGILKSIIPTTIYFSQKHNSYNNSLLKKKYPTLKNTSKKHKKGKSDIFSFKKRNNLILSTNVQNNINNKNMISDMKKNLVIDNKKKIGPTSLKNKNFIKNLIDNFKNCNKRDNFLKNINKNNKTFKNIVKSINMNKIMSNKFSRKCKSKSPTITTNHHKKNSKINKTRTNLKLLNSIFIISNNILNEISNNKNAHNVHSNLMNNNNINNITSSFDKDTKSREFGNGLKKKKTKKMKTELDNYNLNNEYIKSNNTRTTTINNINLSLNLNNQHYIGKSDNINIINSENINKNKFFIVKNSIKSSKIFQMEEKRTNNSLKSKDKIKIKKNSKNKKSNNSNNKFSKITSNKVKQHYKKVSIQLNQDKNIINKNIIKNDLNKRKSLNHKNKLFSINISNNQSKNSLIKNFKNNFNSVINDDYTEYLTERKYINSEINTNNSNNNLNMNSYSKDKNKKYSYKILPNKNIYSLKNKILLCKNINDKAQNKQNIEDKIINSFRNYSINSSKNCLHKKTLTNISSFLYDIHFKKHSNNYCNRNIFKYNKNNMSNEFSLKKASKSNYNEYLLNDPIKSLINNRYFIKSEMK